MGIHQHSHLTHGLTAWVVLGDSAAEMEAVARPEKNHGPDGFFVVQFETWCKICTYIYIHIYTLIYIYIYINIYIYTLYIYIYTCMYMYTCLWIWLNLLLIGLYVEHRWAKGILAAWPRCRVSYASKHLSGIPGLWRVKYHGGIPLALAWNLEKSDTTRMMVT